MPCQDLKLRTVRTRIFMRPIVCSVRLLVQGHASARRRCRNFLNARSCKGETGAIVPRECTARQWIMVLEPACRVPPNGGCHLEVVQPAVFLLHSVPTASLWEQLSSVRADCGPPSGAHGAGTLDALPPACWPPCDNWPDHR